MALMSGMLSGSMIGQRLCGRAVFATDVFKTVSSMTEIESGARYWSFWFYAF